MATKRTATPAVEEAETTTANEPTAKQTINGGIDRVLEASGIGVQHSRYKAMRAIAFQAFTEAIESDDFDGLVDRAIANVDSLPAGWELERTAAEPKAAPVKKAAAAKAAPAARPSRAKAASVKPTGSARKRPTR